MKPDVTIWGTFKVFVGVLAASSSLFGMVQSVNRSPGSWWGPITLASAVLLAIEGVFQLLTGAHSNFLIVLAAMVPIGVFSLSGDWPPRIWVLAAMMAFLEWTIRRLSHATGRSEIGTLVFSTVLGAALANTTVELFRYYWDAPSFWTLHQIFGFMFPIVLPWVLIVILIVHSGRDVLRPRTEVPETTLRPGDAANQDAE